MRTHISLAIGLLVIGCDAGRDSAGAFDSAGTDSSGATGQGSSDGDFGTDSASGGFTGGGTDGTGGAAFDLGEPPPPEEEEDADFRVPRASGKYVYSASTTTNRVAVIDSDTIAIDVVTVGSGPTVVMPIPGVPAGQDHLQRARPVQRHLPGPVDDAHATPAQLPQHLVALGGIDARRHRPRNRYRGRQDVGRERGGVGRRVRRPHVPQQVDALPERPEQLGSAGAQRFGGHVLALLLGLFPADQEAGQRGRRHGGTPWFGSSSRE